jgi:hypothetical protein
VLPVVSSATSPCSINSSCGIYSMQMIKSLSYETHQSLCTCVFIYFNFCIHIYIFSKLTCIQSIQETSNQNFLISKTNPLIQPNIIVRVTVSEFFRSKNTRLSMDSPIAIVGIGLRLPGGCHDGASYWDLLYVFGDDLFSYSGLCHDFSRDNV